MTPYSFKLNNTIGSIHNLDWHAKVIVKSSSKDSNGACHLGLLIQPSFTIHDQYDWQGTNNLPIAVGNAFLDKISRIVRVDRAFGDDGYLADKSGDYPIDNHWLGQERGLILNCCKK